MTNVIQNGIVNGFANILDWFFLDIGLFNLGCSNQTFVGGQDAHFSPGHLFLVYGDVVCQMVNGNAHVIQHIRLNVEKRKKIVGQYVDLVGDAGQGLCCKTSCFIDRLEVAFLSNSLSIKL
ncbi:hypothetical protein BpHYR1_034292 [Brachionus plicatilis]|uniref:Uncharacterized protein n=1 Tax=Brachionus plicatilis TaxID=10195 RepID=A0A3M7RUQ6_BRAPC|nr:hypothetical protein BpHYR1_034292 [Brachionus plicatilis]